MIARAELEEVLRSTVPDEEIVERVRGGDVGQFEILMRRYNERLFRVARSIVHDEREAEDVMQDTYVRAYSNLAQFRGEARFATWLTKIGVHEAMARVRKRSRFVRFDDIDAGERHDWESITRKIPSPEEELSNDELRKLLEAAVAALPESHRTVFVLREIESLDTMETSECLDITPASVRVRLHRARAMLRQNIDRRLGEETRHLYGFHLIRCDRVVSGVFDRIETLLTATMGLEKEP